jgi:hypothetical protein
MKLKKLKDFYSLNIFAREAAGAQETHEGGHEAQMRHGGMGPTQGHATHARSLVECHLAYVFLWLTPS